MVDFFSGGRIMWLVLLLDHFFLGLQKDGTIPCPMIWISLVIHAIQRYLLASTPALPSICVAATRVVVISLSRKSYSCFLAAEIQNFSPSFLVVHIHLSRCCGFSYVGW
jgi:hypothetical protein